MALRDCPAISDHHRACLILAERAKHGAVRRVGADRVLVVAAGRLRKLRGDAHAADEDGRGRLGLDRQLRNAAEPMCRSERI